MEEQLWEKIRKLQENKIPFFIVLLEKEPETWYLEFEKMEKRANSTAKTKL